MNLFLEGLAPAWAATPPRKEVALFRDSVPLTEDVASCPAEGSSTRSLAAASPRRGLVQEVKQKPPGLWSLPWPAEKAWPSLSLTCQIRSPCYHCYQ